MSLVPNIERAMSPSVESNRAEPTHVLQDRAIQALRELVRRGPEGEAINPELARVLGTSAIVEAAAHAEDIQYSEAEVHERLKAQVDGAYEGHAALVRTLNLLPPGGYVEKASRRTIAKEVDAWLDADRITYITERMNEGFTPHLIATPNVHVGYGVLHSAAKGLNRQLTRGRGPWNVSDGHGGMLVPTRHNNVHKLEGYTPEQLSGTNPKNRKKVALNVVFQEEEIELGTIPELRQRLRQQQAERPFLDAPSPLKALTYYHTLREKGIDLDPDIPESEWGERTVTRGNSEIVHYTLPRRLKHWDKVSGHKCPDGMHSKHIPVTALDNKYGLHLYISPFKGTYYSHDTRPPFKENGEDLLFRARTFVG